MTTTKVFQSGNSQAVRIPREFQFDVTEVEIERQGDALVLRPLLQRWLTCQMISTPKAAPTRRRNRAKDCDGAAISA